MGRLEGILCHLGDFGGLPGPCWKPSWASWASWSAPRRRHGRPGSLGRGGDACRWVRRPGGALEDYRNLARQHLAFQHASTCQGSQWRITRRVARDGSAKCSVSDLCWVHSGSALDDRGSRRFLALSAPGGRSRAPGPTTTKTTTTTTTTTAAATTTTAANDGIVNAR